MKQKIKKHTIIIRKKLYDKYKRYLDEYLDIEFIILESNKEELCN